MTTEPEPAGTTRPPDADHASASAEQREAFEYWGYLIKDDKSGTAIFDRLLKGIAQVISDKFAPHDGGDITPSQLAAFYRAVGGDYDVLFRDTPPTSISFIYKSLGAFHSLQPAPDDDGYSAPTIPALKQKGFVTWQTIQLLLGPEEHMPFLQNAVKLFDVKDPETGRTFPKVLPNECFPDRPDDAMEEWYDRVAERLKNEAEAETGGHGSTRVRVEVDDRVPRTSSDASDGDERHGAANYFADPLYRKARTRPPAFVRRFSKQPSYVDERGTGRVVSRVRHMLNPLLGPRRRTADDDYSEEEDATPVAAVPPTNFGEHYRFPPVSHKRPHAPRREGSLDSTDSDSGSDQPPSRRRSPVLRHHRSHDAQSPPQRGYFPNYHDARRYSRDGFVPPPPPGPPPDLTRKAGSPINQGGYGPTKAPLTATYVAQAQQAQQYQYPDRRPSMPVRGSYRPSVRYTSGVPLTERYEPRDRSGDAYDGSSNRHRPGSRSHEWERDRERARRKSEEYPRERRDSPRTRSHDRTKEEWNERDGDWERHRRRDGDRDRDRDRDDDRMRGARYVPGTQDGVSGRRYPVEWSR